MSDATPPAAVAELLNMPANVARQAALSLVSGQVDLIEGRAT